MITEMFCILPTWTYRFRIGDPTRVLPTEDGREQPLTSAWADDSDARGARWWRSLSASILIAPNRCYSYR